MARRFGSGPFPCKCMNFNGTPTPMPNPDLVALIRDRAKRGEISHLSLINDGRQWSASFAPSVTYGVLRATAPDPVDALVDVLTQAAAKVARTKTEKPNQKLDPDIGAKDDFNFDADDTDMDFG